MFSIISVCKNAEKIIERTIRSVAAQNFQDYEYIIIDGQSQDGTLDVIKHYEKNITKLVSEPDTGIYNAMNKGIVLARGEYLLFLNAGDFLLHENVLSIAAGQLDKNPVDVFFGHNLNVCKSTGKAYVRTQRPYVNGLTLFRQTLPHQATFISRQALGRIGLYDDSLRIAADYEWFLRAFLRHRCAYRYHNFVCAVFTLDGISNNLQLGEMHKRERETVSRKYYACLFYWLYSKEFLYWKLVKLNDLLRWIFRLNKA